MSFKPYDPLDHAHLFGLGFRVRGSVQSLFKYGAGNFITEAIATIDHSRSTILLQTAQLNTSAAYIANRLVTDVPWRTTTITKFEQVAQQYFEETDRFYEQSFSDLSDAALSNAIEPVLSLQQTVTVLGAIVQGLVPEGNHLLFDTIKNGLIQALHSDQLYADTWSKLMLPTKLSFTQTKDVAIARFAAESAGSEDSRSSLKAIHRKYAWLGTADDQSERSLDHFERDLEQARAENTNLHLIEQMQEREREQAELMDSLHVNQRDRTLIALARDLTHMGQYLTDVLRHGLWCYEPFFKELAKRKNVADWHDLECLLPWEIADFIASNKPNADDLKSRREYCCLNVRQDSVEILTGAAAKQFVSLLGIEK